GVRRAGPDPRDPPAGHRGRRGRGAGAARRRGRGHRLRERELRVRARRRSPEAHLVPRGGGLHDSPGRLLRGGQEHTSELQSRFDLVCRLLLEKKKKTYPKTLINTRKMLATELIVTIIGTLSHITMNLHYIA